MSYDPVSVCVNCQARFQTADALQKHLRRAHGPRPLGALAGISPEEKAAIASLDQTEPGQLRVENNGRTTISPRRRRGRPATRVALLPAELQIT
jgi:hypothetical protein